jgi:hypothetical protein
MASRPAAAPFIMRESPSSLNPLIRGCQEACLQCLRVATILPPERYGSPAAGHSSIGAHMRHCLDHFFCFFAGWDSGQPIDYDARQRNPALERDPEAARRAIESIMERLGALEGQDPRRPVTVLQMPAADAQPAPLSSTLERELVFLSSHCIHHLALMRLLVEMIDGARDLGDVGVAYSTAAYRDCFAGLGDGI